MEQRPENPSPVVLGAGTDPTYIPGLDAPASGPPETADEPDENAASPEPAESAEAAEASEVAEPDGETPDAETAATGPVADDDGEKEAEDEAAPEGPAFSVSDHRGSIVADGNGLVFRLDDTEARFRWDEIGSVEIGASRFGRRFEVAVGTTDHRRFDAEVIASSKQRLQEWTTELDAVLDAWFEDGKE